MPAPRNGNHNGKPYLRRTPQAAPQPPLMAPSPRALGALRCQLVTDRQHSPLDNEYLERYHYLGYQPLPGAQLRYFIRAHERIVALLGFKAAAWKTQPRDLFIGWSPKHREARLHLLVNNARFLILPWIRRKNLGSRILGMTARQLADDWQHRYGCRPALLETFVERPRFHGTCYLAANWIYLGETQGPGNLERLAGALLVLNVGGTRGFPEADTLFVGNQTRLGPESTSFYSQIIWTLDDLGYDANQSLALSPGVRDTDNISFFINTLISAKTLRGTESRFKEPGSGAELDATASLFSISTRLNNTNDNQGDHCIFAANADAGRPPNIAGNQVLDTTLCSAFGASVKPPARNFAVGTTFQRRQSRQFLRKG